MTQRQQRTPDSSSSRFTEITPTDDATFTDQESRAIFVGVGGDINIDDETGTATVHKNVANGAILPLRSRRVRSTSTTATDIVFWY